MFYILYESRDKENKDTDPLLIWMRGQPGCSVSGDLTENNAPVRFDRNRTDHNPADVVFNELSWNNFSNVLFLDQPVGTGYSYRRIVKNEKDKREKTLNQAVTDFVHFMKEFYVKHPQFQYRDLYLAANDFTAGMYLPVFAQAIQDLKKEVFVDTVFDDRELKESPKSWDDWISLKGIVLINPILDWAELRASAADYAFETGLVSQVSHYLMGYASILCKRSYEVEKVFV